MAILLVCNWEDFKKIRVDFYITPLKLMTKGEGGRVGGGGV